MTSQKTDTAPEYTTIRVRKEYRDKLKRLAKSQKRPQILQFEYLVDAALESQTPAPAHLYQHQTTDRS